MIQRQLAFRSERLVQTKLDAGFPPAPTACKLYNAAAAISRLLTPASPTPRLNRSAMFLQLHVNILEKRGNRVAGNDFPKLRGGGWRKQNLNDILSSKLDHVH